jgi:hypothetical protein
VSFTVSAWESMLRTYLVCREKERETSKLHVGDGHSVLITAILLPKRLCCYWGKTVSLRMLTNLRLADLRMTTAQQRSTVQNLPSDLYRHTQHSRKNDPSLWQRLVQRRDYTKNTGATITEARQFPSKDKFNTRI